MSRSVPPAILYSSVPPLGESSFEPRVLETKACRVKRSGRPNVATTCAIVVSCTNNSSAAFTLRPFAGITAAVASAAGMCVVHRSRLAAGPSAATAIAEAEKQRNNIAGCARSITRIFYRFPRIGRPTRRCTRRGAVCWPGTKVAYLLGTHTASRPLHLAPSGATISRGSGRAALPLRVKAPRG